MDDNPQLRHLSGLPAALVALSFFVILAFMVLFACLACRPSQRQSLKGDFPEWIIGARLLQAMPDRLYDLDLQRREYHSLAGRGGLDYPYVYPPFVAASFVPLTAFPFYVSLLLWGIISAALYGCALALVAPPYQRRVALWLALASPLFLWYGTQ